MVRFIAWVWLGLVVGVSFLATPVKFSAPSLTLPVALDVGRVTFAAFEWLQWGVWALLAVVAVEARRRGRMARGAWALVAMLGIILAIQSLTLLPILGERVQAVIDGRSLPPSSVHRVFGVFEVIKALALAALGAVAGRGVGPGSPVSDPAP